MKIGIIVLFPLVLCDVAQNVIDAIQESRKKYNLRELKVIDPLIEIARDRTEFLAGSKELINKTEVLWDLAEKHGYKPIAMGENIGKSISKEKEGMDIFEEWIKSETHRENIINAPEYTHLGVYKLKTETTIYLSAIFGQLKILDKEETAQPKNSVLPAESNSNNGPIVTSTRTTAAPSQPPLIEKQPADAQMGPAAAAPAPSPIESKNATTAGAQQSEMYNTIELVYPGIAGLDGKPTPKIPIQFVLVGKDGKEIQQVPKLRKETEQELIQKSTLTPRAGNFLPQLLSASSAAIEPIKPGTSNEQMHNMPLSSPNVNPQHKTVIKLIMVQPSPNTQPSIRAEPAVVLI
ncbi:hypothetical protein NEAUS05_1411 [Nematocida ausubeli]|nr:hypothetical protein NEAUS05_1411 [Nematocida ausubeli]